MTKRTSTTQLNKALTIACLSYALLANSSFATEPPAIHFKVQSFNVEGALPVPIQTINDYLHPLEQRDYSLKDLQGVSSGLEQLLQAQGYGFYRVVLPPQTLNAGKVTLKVVFSPLGTIDISGNQIFSRDNILASLPILKQGTAPNTQDVASALKIANRHPSKQVQIVFKQGKAADQIDADIKVREQRPYQASLLANNFGTSSSGAYRLTGALQYSNLWGRDHIINASYTTSPDNADNVQQYGGSYSLPLYALKASLNAYYAYSNVNTGIVASDLTVTGSGEMYGIHYQQILPKFANYEHSLDIGIDNRYFSSDVSSAGVIANSTVVRSAPFSVLYRGDYGWQSVQAGYSLQWLKNTDFGEHNNQKDYVSSTGSNNAKQNWDMLRYSANLTANVQQWLIQTHFIGQYSSTPMIAGEQLGLGGSYDIRGYAQRETSADSGEIAKLEITAPAWQQLRFFAFYDVGHGYLSHATATQMKDWILSGAGIGARWQWRDYLMANIAFATAINNGINTHAGDSRIHANIVLKY
ncbi:MAG: ShlB/FhaC/HecB family hemolysin secretion/activation protein [Methylococcaceae bacterium]